jgi:hypothetical protein
VESLPQGAHKLLGGVFVLEADHAIVTVSHDHDVAPCVPAAPLGGPEVKDLVERAMRTHRAGTAPLGRPFLLLSPVPILQPARLEPLTDGADDALVPHPGLDTLHQPCVVTRIVKAPHIGSEYPGDVARFHAYRDGIHRVVRAASWAGTVREPEKLFLVEGVEPLDCRPLDDLVFQRRRADGSLAPISCRTVAALARWGLLGAPLQAV